MGKVGSVYCQIQSLLHSKLKLTIRIDFACSVQHGEADVSHILMSSSAHQGSNIADPKCSKNRRLNDRGNNKCRVLFYSHISYVALPLFFYQLFDIVLGNMILLVFFSLFHQNEFKGSKCSKTRILLILIFPCS